MKTMKKVFALLMSLALAVSLSTAAFAAENPIPMVVINGAQDTDSSVEWINADTTYTSTDLFPEFKNVMPGDTLTQTVYIKNDWTNKDYIRLYMTAVLHDVEKNPVSEKVSAKLDGETDQEKLDNMHDFLHQLTLTVKNGETVIYTGHPDELEKGFEKDEPYSFGKIYSGDTVKLDVTLEVPIELSNDYADAIGEVDWVFTWSGHNSGGGKDPDPTPTPGTDPEPTPPDPGTDPEPTPPDPGTDPEPDIPLTPVEPPVEPSKPAGPKTGDETMIWPYVLLFAAGLAGMLATTRKRKQK